MKTIKPRLIKISERLLDFFIRWRRAFFVPFFFILVLMEASEMTGGKPIHYFELVIYFILLVIIALLNELLIRSAKLQKRAAKILDYKHQINWELVAYEDWDGLASRLTERLAKMAEAKGAQLFLWESPTEDFSLLAQWIEGGNHKQSIDMPCKNCMEDWIVSAKATFGPCRITAESAVPSEAQTYCLPVYYQEEIFALVRFLPDSEKIFTHEQIKTLGELGDEIAIALVTGQDRKKLAELQITQVALAERHSVSQYLHDSLGQNIGYLNMKLEQFSLHPSLLQESNAISEIQRMKETAEQSYAIVRNKLEDIHSNTKPTLASYLREHAHRISERAGFEFTFKIRGNPKPISMDVQRAVFYVFQEALSNVEKHAEACNVDIVLAWGRDKLVLTIHDNGIGFNPKTVNLEKHFGLGIVRERMINVNGRIEVNSMESSGTTIKISVPFSSTIKQG
jgi:signal transduction histidine kinase